MKHKLLFFFTLITTFLQAQAFNQYDRLWSTYVGGNGLSFPKIVKDNYGNIIVAGSMRNTSFNLQHTLNREYFQGFIYPTENPLMYQSNDYVVSYVTKFSPNGTLITANYLPYQIIELEVDYTNHIVITGTTFRRDLGTSNVWFPAPGENWNGLVKLISKLDTNFNAIWTTYLPIKENYHNNIALDEQGNIYGTGLTNIDNGITTEGTFYPVAITREQGASQGNGLLFKLNPNGQLIWGTFYANGLFTDIDYYNQKLYITLRHNIREQFTIDFPWITENAYQTTPSISILSRFNALNGRRELATYYGENDKLFLSNINVTNDGIYVTGDTENLSNNTALITSNSYQSVYGGGSTDIYIARLDDNFTPIWSTYFGGNDMDYAGFEAKSLEYKDNHLYVTGITESTDLIFDDNTFRSTNNGNFDLLMIKFNPNGQLVWGSFFGSNGIEDLSSILPINDETFYLAGRTDSPKDITTPNTHQQYYSYLPNNGDFGQLFLAKFGRNDDLSTSDISTSTLKIYPNPTKDKVYIKGFIHQDSLIEVYNLVGQKVITQKAKSGLTQTIEVQFLPKGTYIIKAIDINGKVFQEKLLIN